MCRVDSTLSKAVLSLGVQWIFCSARQAQLERINIVHYVAADATFHVENSPMIVRLA